VPQSLTVNISTEVMCDRTIALALVDEKACCHPDVEALIWKVIDIPAGGLFEASFDLSGEFGITVSKGSSTYMSRGVNRIGALTKISNRNQTLIINNPEFGSRGNKQDIRVHNASDSAFDLSIGVLGCNKTFEPVLRRKSLPPGGDFMSGFHSLTLRAYFVEADTAVSSLVAESGEFASVSLSSLKAQGAVTVEVCDYPGQFKARMI